MATLLFPYVLILISRWGVVAAATLEHGRAIVRHDILRAGGHRVGVAPCTQGLTAWWPSWGRSFLFRQAMAVGLVGGSEAGYCGGGVWDG